MPITAKRILFIWLATDPRGPNNFYASRFFLLPATIPVARSDGPQKNGKPMDDDTRRVFKAKLLVIVIGIIIVVPTVVWKLGLF
jgi:hypothetical protein